MCGFVIVQCVVGVFVLSIVRVCDITQTLTILSTNTPTTHCTITKPYIELTLLHPVEHKYPQKHYIAQTLTILSTNTYLCSTGYNRVSSMYGFVIAQCVVGVFVLSIVRVCAI
jgi:hypothetical protein